MARRLIVDRNDVQSLGIGLVVPVSVGVALRFVHTVAEAMTLAVVVPPTPLAARLTIGHLVSSTSIS